MKRLLVLCALSLPGLAAAQSVPEDSDRDEKKETIGAGEPSENLPKPESDDDPQPQVAAPVPPEGMVVRQAGVGGTVAYGRAGVLELGGSASFARATDFTQLSLNPTLGWFFMDNLELSAILGLSHIEASGASETFVSLLAEPSFHIPFSRTAFGFLGLGVGASYADEPGLGFALAPRIGTNLLLGRSGVLTPALYAQYSTHDAIQTTQGTLLAVSLSYGLNVGYTVMW